jgi:excisionase family DNA binding protein
MLLTVIEVARELRVDSTTVRRWIHNGCLDALELPRIGKRKAYRIEEVELEKILEGGSGCLNSK